MLDSFHGVPFNVTVRAVGNSTLDYCKGKDRTIEPSVQNDSAARCAELACTAPIETQYEHTCHLQVWLLAHQTRADYDRQVRICQQQAAEAKGKRRMVEEAAGSVPPAAGPEPRKPRELDEEPKRQRKFPPPAGTTILAAVLALSFDHLKYFRG